MVDVLIVSTAEELFKGKAERVSLPGEAGVFEVWNYHRPLVSRLLAGVILIDDQPLPIRRGVVNVGQNTLTAIVEPAGSAEGSR